jgi:hypothetical protein
MMCHCFPLLRVVRQPCWRFTSVVASPVGPATHDAQATATFVRQQLQVDFSYNYAHELDRVKMLPTGFAGAREPRQAAALVIGLQIYHYHG